MNFGQWLSGQMLNLLWLKIIIYDYDMLILGRIETKYKITDFEIESYSLDKNALLIYFQNEPDK